jgi:hypothetical protein
MGLMYVQRCARPLGRVDLFRLKRACQSERALFLLQREPSSDGAHREGDHEQVESVSFGIGVP